MSRLSLVVDRCLRWWSPEFQPTATDSEIISASGRSVFVSYSRVDSGIAHELFLFLESRGVVAWLDSASIRPVADWRSAIGEGIRGSEEVIVLLSRYSVASSWVQAEWETARDAAKPLTVWLIDNCEVPEGLVGAPLVDLRSDPLDEAAWTAALDRDSRVAPRSVLGSVRPAYVRRYERAVTVSAAMCCGLLAPVLALWLTGHRFDRAPNAHDDWFVVCLVAALDTSICADALLLRRRLRARSEIYRPHAVAWRISAHVIAGMLGVFAVAAGATNDRAAWVLGGVGLAAAALLAWSIWDVARRQLGGGWVRTVNQALVRPFLGPYRRPFRSAQHARELTGRNWGLAYAEAPIALWCPSFRYIREDPWHCAPESSSPQAAGSLTFGRLVVAYAPEDARAAAVLGAASSSHDVQLIALAAGASAELVDAQQQGALVAFVVSTFSTRYLTDLVNAPGFSLWSLAAIVLDQRAAVPTGLHTVQAIDATALDLHIVRERLIGVLDDQQTRFDGERDRRANLLGVAPQILRQPLWVVLSAAFGMPAPLGDSRLGGLGRMLVAVEGLLACVTACLFVRRRASAYGIAMTLGAFGVTSLIAYTRASNPGSNWWGAVFACGFAGLALHSHRHWQHGDPIGVWVDRGRLDAAATILAVGLVGTGAAIALR